VAGSGGGSETSAALLEAAQALVAGLGSLRVGGPVTHVYNPLVYAWGAFETYVRRFASGPRRVVFLGMNPGPFGMTQTGVPFGEVAAVRDWMGIAGGVVRPAAEHPKRPIEGFECRRSEVSGRRLWGWAAARFGPAERFFEHNFVANYCPLVFLEAGGRNRTPDQLPASEQAALARACDAHLVRVLEVLRPEWALGIGGFAERRLREVVSRAGGGPVPRVGTILHPSPASPAANRDWAGTVNRQLSALGVFD
jgi:single-strand selective monofunctional uracil DNA glycosylase